MKAIRAETKDLIYFKDRKDIPIVGYKWSPMLSIVPSNEVIVIELDFYGNGNKDLLVFQNGYLLICALSKNRENYLIKIYRDLIQKKGIKRKTFLRRIINAFILKEVGLSQPDD